MSTRDSRCEGFLEELGFRLSQLGAEESAEIVGEIRTHLDEAMAEGDGLDAALQEFGSADDLAASILRERGLLAEEPRIPDAPLWRRVLAWTLDALIAGVLAVWIGTWVIGTALSPIWRMPGVARDTLVYSAVWFAVALFWAVTYWGNRSPVARRPSWGLYLTGLRRVGVRGDTRTVRASAVPGGRAGWRYAIGGVFAIALVGLTVMGSWQSAKDNARTSSEQSLQLSVDAASWDTSSFTQAASAAVVAAIDEAHGRAASIPKTTGDDAKADYDALVDDARELEAVTWEYLGCSELIYRDEGELMRADAEADVTFTLWGVDSSGKRAGRTWTAHLIKTVTTPETVPLEEATSWSAEYALDDLRAEPVTVTAGL